MEYKIEKNINDRIGEIETDLYKWTQFRKDEIFDKTAQKYIYQGKFVSPSTGKYDGTLPNESWLDFLHLVDKLLLDEKEAIRKKTEELLDEFEKLKLTLHGTKSGWCEKCGTYCFGDCQF